MDLGLDKLTFAVGGASGGLGLAITKSLIGEGATVIGIARGREKLEALAKVHRDQFISFPADLSDASDVDALAERLMDEQVEGLVLNSGGPPPGPIGDLGMQDWDAAYAGTLRWKIQLVTKMLPMMRKRKRGSFLFVESVSIKQPIDNLVLSNAFRAAAAGFVKTLSREEGPQGIVANILAPGYHGTDRITQVLQEAARLQKTTVKEVEKAFLAEVPVGRLGDPEEFARMATFLLSPSSRFISGQTITIDGGMVRYLTG